MTFVSVYVHLSVSEHVCEERKGRLFKTQGYAFGLNSIHYHLGKWDSWIDGTVDHFVFCPRSTQ